MKNSVIRITSLLLIVTIIFGLCSCANQNDSVKKSYKDIVSKLYDDPVNYIESYTEANIPDKSVLKRENCKFGITDTDSDGTDELIVNFNEENKRGVELVFGYDKANKMSSLRGSLGSNTTYYDNGYIKTSDGEENTPTILAKFNPDSGYETLYKFYDVPSDYSIKDAQPAQDNDGDGRVQYIIDYSSTDATPTASSIDEINDIINSCVKNANTVSFNLFDLTRENIEKVFDDNDAAISELNNGDICEPDDNCRKAIELVAQNFMGNFEYNSDATQYNALLYLLSLKEYEHHPRSSAKKYYGFPADDIDQNLSIIFNTSPNHSSEIITSFGNDIVYFKDDRYYIDSSFYPADRFNVTLQSDRKTDDGTYEATFSSENGDVTIVYNCVYYDNKTYASIYKIRCSDAQDCIDMFTSMPVTTTAAQSTVNTTQKPVFTQPSTTYPSTIADYSADSLNYQIQGTWHAVEGYCYHDNFDYTLTITDRSLTTYYDEFEYYKIGDDKTFYEYYYSMPAPGYTDGYNNKISWNSQDYMSGSNWYFDGTYLYFSGTKWKR